MENKQRAEFAYRAYAIAHGMVDPAGEPLFPWETLAACCSRAWEVTAAAVAAEVRGEQVLRESLTQTAAAAEALAALSKAVESMPETCPYHGSHTDPENLPYPWTSEACCACGIPAQRRKRAEEAVTTLREMLGA